MCSEELKVSYCSCTPIGATIYLDNCARDNRQYLKARDSQRIRDMQSVNAKPNNHISNQPTSKHSNNVRKGEKKESLPPGPIM